MADSKLAEPAKDEAWPLRSGGLALLGAVLGLAIHQLLDNAGYDHPGAMALATFLFISGLAIALTLERSRVLLAAGFSGLCGIVVALVVYWNVVPDEHEFDEPWRLACAVLAACIAVPLFQAWRAKGGGGLGGLDYRVVHTHAWTAALTGFATLLFVLLVWLMAWLLAALFNLIGLDFLERLLGRGWFGAMLTGAASGGVIGMLRDKHGLLAAMQRIVMTILSVLAPVMGAGLALFLLLLPFTGLESLWNATRSTTPIMLTSVVFAFVLANAAIGDGPEEESGSRLVRWGAMALGAVMLPLGLIAAVSTGSRIGQHGLTPDRLWAAVFVAMACVAGGTYLWALVMRRRAWVAGVRSANLLLAIGLCSVALVLASPLVSFGALSASSQVSRLESGEVSPDKFDWTAMRFDFGQPGRAALARLSKNANPQIARLASAVLAQDSRYGTNEVEAVAQEATARIRTVPLEATIPEDLKTAIVQDIGCQQDRPCVLLYQPGETRAIVVGQYCEGCAAQAMPFELTVGVWRRSTRGSSDRSFEAWNSDGRAQAQALETGKVELRAVTRHQVYIDGKPVGDLVD